MGGVTVASVLTCFAQFLVPDEDDLRDNLNVIASKYPDLETVRYLDVFAMIFEPPQRKVYTATAARLWRLLPVDSYKWTGRCRYFLPVSSPTVSGHLENVGLEARPRWDTRQVLFRSLVGPA